MKDNLVFLIPTLSSGGAERIVSNLSFELSSKYNIYIALQDSSKVDYSYNGKILETNTPISKEKIFQQVFEGSYELSKIKKRYDPKATISFLSLPNVVNVLSEFFLGSTDHQSILSVHNFTSIKESHIYEKIHNLILGPIYNKSDLIIAVSKGVKEDLVSNFGVDKEKIEVIYNPIDIKEIQKQSREKLERKKFKKLFENNGPTITTLGSLSEQKGHWHLIRAFKYVKKEFPKAKLIIMGKGNLKQYLSNLARKLDLEKDVFFTGFIENPFKFISKSDLFVLSSLYEGLGNVIIESMACSTPVVSTDCRYGPREILAPNTDFKYETKEKIDYVKYGILTPVCDGTKYGEKQPLTKEEHLLGEAMITILKDHTLRKKYENLSEKRMLDFSLEKIAKDWLNILR